MAVAVSSTLRQKKKQTNKQTKQNRKTCLPGPKFGSPNKKFLDPPLDRDCPLLKSILQRTKICVLLGLLHLIIDTAFIGGQPYMDVFRSFRSIL